MYLLESPRRGDSNKYPKRMFSYRITWDCQWKSTRFTYFTADRIDVMTNFAVIKKGSLYTELQYQRAVNPNHSVNQPKYQSIAPFRKADEKALIKNRFNRIPRPALKANGKEKQWRHGAQSRMLIGQMHGRDVVLMSNTEWYYESR